MNNYFAYDDRQVETNPVMQRMHELWDVLFRPYLNRDAPNYVFADCCAQFVVSRERILRHPLKAYKHWYHYMAYEDPKDDGGYEIGMIFEYIWHIIFGEADVLPEAEQRKMFRCDDV